MDKIFFDKVYYKSSEKMKNIPDCSVDLIVTSPPYFNIKDYFKDGYQAEIVSNAKTKDMGNIDCFNKIYSAYCLQREIISSRETLT